VKSREEVVKKFVLEMLNLEDFIEELKRREIKEPVAVAFLNSYNKHFVTTELIATVPDLDKGILLKYINFKKTYLEFEGEKYVDGFNKKRDELVEKLKKEGFRVVGGVYS